MGSHSSHLRLEERRKLAVAHRVVLQRWRHTMNAGARNEPPKADKDEFSQYTQMMTRHFQESNSWLY